MAVNQQKLMGRTTTVQAANVAPQQQLVASPADTALLKDISKSLTNIIQLLSNQNVQTKKDAEQTRRSQERTRRQGIELGLERSFATVKNVASAVVAPVKSILDQIIQFFVTIFLGRALILLLNWFADENNRGKIRSIMRFLSDWWPSLVAGYILFGTGFGRIVRKVAGIAVGVTARLVVVAARLTKAILTGQILKRKGIASVFAGGGKLGGVKGFLLKGAIAAGATVATGMAVNNMMGGGGNAPQVDVPEAPAVPALGAYTGGFASIKDLFSSATSGIGSKINPFTSFFGSGSLASLMQGMSGVVSGQKGIDKVPAMLTDGEFVMSRGAVQKFGVNTLEAMNSAGGGTNQPKIIRGIPHAAGGGLIGGVDELRQKYDAKHGAGSYDKESARRKASLAQEDSSAEAKKGRKPTYVESASVRQLRERARTQGNTNYTSVNGVRIPGVKFDPKMISSTPTVSGDQISKTISAKAQGLVSSISASTGAGSGRLTAEQQRKINADNAQRNSIVQQRQQARDASKQARAEYLKILRDQSHPLHDKAAFGDLTLSEFKKNYKPTIAAPTTPAATGSKPGKPGMGYTPYKSKFTGYRDAAFAKAQNIGGSPAFKSQDYYKANTAAKEKQLSGLSSQQRLSALSTEGKGKGGGGYGGLSFGGSKGRKFDAQSKAQAAETASRGGMMGQLGRSFTKMFGGKKDRERVVAQDKASDARVKQAGAASIGRYYSSSDGKYYKDYNAAKKARLARTSPKGKTITPTPKPAPKVITKPTGGGKGGLSKPRGGSKPSVPSFSASAGSNRKVKNTLGIKH